MPLLFGLSPLLSLIMWGGLVLFIAGGGFEAARVWDAGTINGLKTQIAQGQTRETRLSDNVATCTANQKTLQATIDTQNASVTALKAAGDEASTRATKAAAKADKASAHAKAMADQIASLLPMPGTQESCPQADAVILRGLK